MLEHQYEIYVNDKLMQVTYPNCQYEYVPPQNSAWIPPEIGKIC